MKTNLIDPVRSGKGTTLIIKDFLFDNSFWNSKDRNIIIFFILLGVVLFSLKVFGNDNDQEIINQIKDKYNNIRKEYYEKDNITIEKLENDINLLTNKKEIITKCRDYNYSHYNTVVEPINCDEQLESQLKIIEGWKVNSSGQSQAFIPLVANGTEERMNELLLKFDRGEDVLDKRWQRVGEKYNIKTPVLVCIAKADSSLGKALKTKNNFGNVGNNDRGDTQSFASPIEGIEVIAKTLNNKYLGEYTQLWQLYGSSNPNGKNYATELTNGVRSNNAYNNVINCLSSLYGERISDTFSFRN